MIYFLGKSVLTIEEEEVDGKEIIKEDCEGENPSKCLKLKEIKQKVNLLDCVKGDCNRNRQENNENDSFIPINGSKGRKQFIPQTGPIRRKPKGK